MTTATLSPNRGMTVFVCVGCDKLALSERSSSITCSATCRSYMHRHPARLNEIKAECARRKIKPAMVQQCAAVIRLRPDLSERIARGEIEIVDTRREMEAAMFRLIGAAA